MSFAGEGFVVVKPAEELPADPFPVPTAGAAGRAGGVFSGLLGR